MLARFRATSLVRGLVLMIGAGAAGCLPVRPTLPPELLPPGGATLGAPVERDAVQQTGALCLPVDHEITLDDLLALATAQNPDLAMARARAQAARGKLVQAGLYPNPKVGWLASQMLSKDNAGGEQGPYVLQEIVTAHKLELAQKAAQAGVEAADWQAMTRWYDVVMRVRVAFYEALAAEAEVKASTDIVRLAEQGLAAAEKLEKGGAGTRPDVLRARAELSLSKQRLEVAGRRADAARRLLGAAVGAGDLPPAPLAGTLDAPPPVYHWEPALEIVRERSSELHEAYALVAQAEGLLRRARVEPTPNVFAQVRPFYSFPEQDKRLYIDIGMYLPVYNRNQGNIQAAFADAEQARQAARATELRLRERLAAAFRRYHAARDQAVSFEESILPDATESLRLVRLGYESGDQKYDYTAMLQALQVLAQARVNNALARGELWKAASEIAGLLQLDMAPIDMLRADCPADGGRHRHRP